MFKRYKMTVVCILIAGCSSQTLPPYQADRSPESRDSYNGVTGVAQWQKDQSYLADKELTGKCELIRTRMIEAHLTENTKLLEKLSKESKDFCII